MDHHVSALVVLADGTVTTVEAREASRDESQRLIRAHQATRNYDDPRSAS